MFLRSKLQASTLSPPPPTVSASLLSFPQKDMLTLSSPSRTGRTRNLTRSPRYRRTHFRTGKSPSPQSRQLRSLRQHSLPGPAPWSDKSRRLPGSSQHRGHLPLERSPSRQYLLHAALWRDLRSRLRPLRPAEHAPYLISHAVPCLRRSPAVWETNVPLNELYRIASEQHWNLPTPITGVRITQHTTSGRAKLLEISGPARTVTISASSLRFGIDRTPG